MTVFLSFIREKWLTLTLFILVCITVLSLWPLPELPQVPGTDKIHHIIAYAVLMIPAAIGRPKKWALFGILYVAYGGLIELIQPYVNRYGEWMDLAANATGLTCGLIIAALINRILPNKINLS